MKVLLCSSFGGQMPDVVKDRINHNLAFPFNRMDKTVIGFIEATCVMEDSSHNSTWLENNKDKILKVKSRSDTVDKYFAYMSDGKYGRIVGISIVDVDTTRKWTISEYDGAEVVEYVDDYICRDEKTNYWVKKI